MPNDVRETGLYVAVGRRIAGARKAKSPKWTQEDLANRTAGSVSRSALANMETGRQRISVFQLYEVAAALDVVPAELLPPPGEIPDGASAALEEAKVRDRAFVEEVRAASQRPSVFEPEGESG